jgi:hypothetical protein
MKLDRVLCTADWEAIYLECFLQSQAIEISDHCPLVLNLYEGVKSFRHFHFENSWSKLLGFLETVTTSWSQPVEASCPLEQVSLKLKRLTRALQSFGHKKVGHVKLQLGIAREILHRLEIAQDLRQLTLEEDWLRCEAKQLCLTLASLERSIARSRSRIRFLKDGDANTSLFHRTATYRKRKNFISKLVTDDRTVTNQEDKQQVMFDFFEQLLGTAGSRNCSLNLGFFHQHGADLSTLDQPISEEEVWDSVKSMSADRAPGPDGYTGQFYKSCWNIIKADFMAAIMTLFQGDDMKLWLLNSA